MDVRIVMSGKCTRKLGIEEKYAELSLEEWYGLQAIKKVYKSFSRVFPENQIYISQQGFEP